MQFSSQYQTLLNFLFLNEQLSSPPHLLIRVRVLSLHVRNEVLLVTGEGHGDHHYQENYHRHDHDQGEDEEQDDACRISGVLGTEMFLEEQKKIVERTGKSLYLSQMSQSQIQMVNESWVVGSVHSSQVRLRLRCWS